MRPLTSSTLFCTAPLPGITEPMTVIAAPPALTNLVWTTSPRLARDSPIAGPSTAASGAPDASGDDAGGTHTGGAPAAACVNVMA